MVVMKLLIAAIVAANGSSANVSTLGVASKYTLLPDTIIHKRVLVFSRYHIAARLLHRWFVLQSLHLLIFCKDFGSP